VRATHRSTNYTILLKLIQLCICWNLRWKSSLESTSWQQLTIIVFNSPSFSAKMVSKTPSAPSVFCFKTKWIIFKESNQNKYLLKTNDIVTISESLLFLEITMSSSDIPSSKRSSTRSFYYNPTDRSSKKQLLDEFSSIYLNDHRQILDALMPSLWNTINELNKRHINW